MTQEEKQILLVDICARLPYRVYYDLSYYGLKPTLIQEAHIGQLLIDTHVKVTNICELIKVDTIKPYLRTMSSMTEEEVKELSYNTLKQPDLELVRSNNFDMNSEEAFRYIDWLNAHHFDYRGLIEKGLALEAPKGMYNN